MFDIAESFPIEWVALAQAVTVDVQIPLAPTRKAIFPATMFPIAIGINNGATRSGPLSCIRIT